jgi:hypothetical protein
MRKLFFLAGMALMGVLAMSSPAAASSTTCGGTPGGETLTGATIPDDLVVPADGSCTIVNSAVGNDVRVGKNAYFEADNSQIGDDVTASSSLTLFIHGGTTVGDNVDATNTPKVFVFDSTFGGHVQVSRSEQTVDVCGNTVNGRIQVRNSKGDILVGDPAPGVDCAGNTVLDYHRIRVENNSVDVELVVNGNTVEGGDLEVNNNSGPADKSVQGNKGGNALECRGNEKPFTASGNTGWNRKEGQCATQPETCNSKSPVSGATFENDVVVPEDGECTLVRGTIGGDVKVGRNAYFQATDTQIAGDVDGNRSLTIFIDGTTVGGSVEASGTFQVFVFGATLNDELEVARTTDKVQVCGTTIDGDVGVERSGRDILFGDPTPGADCAGNTVRNGHSAEFAHNSTDRELTIRGNTFEGGDLTVDDNRGTSDKFVQNNTGGDVLECNGNTPSATGTPFTGTPNAFATEQGQCAEI